MENISDMGWFSILIINGFWVIAFFVWVKSKYGKK